MSSRLSTRCPRRRKSSRSRSITSSASWSPQERCAVLRMPPRRASIRNLPLLKIREGGGGRHFEASCSYPTSEGHPLYLDGRTQVRVSLSASRRQGRHERAVREGPQHDARIPLFGCRL